ncbi:hypothetical protein ACIB24_06095 [Spongisporangium articulatum]|uniref:Uncharacterized protein n=1 Tax=Spongisporangium articulatum TaxID=3362603 RepID=A0ABW8AJT0_9ACTN
MSRQLRIGVAPVTDTLKRVAPDGTVLGTADRDQHRLLVGPVEGAPEVWDDVPHEVAAKLHALGYEIRPLPSA